ncbi:MAG: ISAs1 family transposase [Chitinophagaceae bacterium]|nr:ISAs1 family transposase [Anaerolineae bacterium]
MNDQPLSSISACFSDLHDPRVTGRCEYALNEIITIAICGVIAGADGWMEIEIFGKRKEAWLKQFLRLENGIPSHDTFGDVFRMLNAEAFQRSFTRWIEGVFTVTQGQVIAIDGKTVRRSHDRTIGRDAIHMVSAWASANGITLGQRKVDDKSNEITAIPELLELLNVTGCIVTIDAMGCQKKIAQKIRDEKADYVFSLRENQGKFLQDVQDWFAHADQVNFAGMKHDYHETVNKGHGRIEVRRCWVVSDPVAFDYIRHYEGWADLQTIVRVQRERRFANKTEQETSYYISSLPSNASLILNAIRSHWSIENSLHWVLDVVFREDASRIRKDNSSQNIGVLRKIALNILKQDPSKGSLKSKRYSAALDDTFLLQLLVRL